MTTQLSRERLVYLKERLATRIKSLEIHERNGSISSTQQETLDAFRVALAAMDSEAVGEIIERECRGDLMINLERKFKSIRGFKNIADLPVGTKLYAELPAPAIPDHLELIDKGRLVMLERSHQTLLDYRADSVWYWQGDEDDQPESLSCPVIMSAETLRELLAKSAQQHELTVWYGSMPETNGKTNWTAILHRKGECISTGITIDCSEYPDRVRYEADSMRYLISELPDEPDIMAYDENAHSGYVKPPAAVAVADDEALKSQIKKIWWGSGDAHVMSDETASKIVATCLSTVQGEPIVAAVSDEYKEDLICYGERCQICDEMIIGKSPDGLCIPCRDDMSEGAKS